MIWLLAVLVIAWPIAADGWTGLVVKARDGDDLVIRRDGRQVRVRLWGIDCPEKSQAFGEDARRFLEMLAVGRTVTVETLECGRYGRQISQVTADGKSLSRELVRAGLAWHFRRYAPHARDLEQLQDEARSARRGLWIQPNPVPPWKHRKHKRRPGRSEI